MKRILGFSLPQASDRLNIRRPHENYKEKLTHKDIYAKLA